MNFKLYKKLLSHSFQELLSYRLTAFLITFFGILFFATEIIAGHIYFSVTDSLLGWNKLDYLILVASSTIMIHLHSTLFIASQESLVDKILEGDMDYTFVRPVSSYFFHILYRIEYSSLINLVIACIYQAYILRDVELSFLTILGFVALILLGTHMIFVLNQIVITISFWTERSEKLMAVPEYLTDFSIRPHKIYPGFVRIIFMYILPILLSINAPTLLLRGEFHGTYLIVLLIANILLGILSKFMWERGLRHYASAN
ncbi:MAG: ABC-2 family transporter protein [Tissierellia bacterium]|nr:ABC-2 family transporter protein [Tissierellia bacterium]